MRRWLLVLIAFDLVVSLAVMYGPRQQAHRDAVVASSLQYSPAVPLVTTTSTSSTSTTTTPPPTTTTVKKAPPPQQTVRAAPEQATGEVPSVIIKAFAEVGADVATQQRAVRVARCESSLNPSARSGSHVGLFQLATQYHQPRAERLGFTWEQVSTEAWPNARVAADLWSTNGWTPWTCKG